jgi:hypothetical protein
VDYLVEKTDGTTVAREVKAGGAKRGKDQLEKDKVMETEGGVPVGKNAPDILRGQKIPIKTEEMRY